MEHDAYLRREEENHPEPPHMTPSDTAPGKGDRFEPVDLSIEPVVTSELPLDTWTIVHSAPANFPPNFFLDVSRNLLENPNLTASHLSRAELSYTSFTDPTFNPDAKHPHELAKNIKHLKKDHQPLLVTSGVPAGYKLQWTVVRKLIPRNPKLDDPLLQTCHLFISKQDSIDVNMEGTPLKTVDIPTEKYLIVYLPHVSDPEKIPFYHPKVRGVAILYTFQPSSTPSGTLSIYYDLYPEIPLDNRLTRTALKMLEIIHKHSRGRQAGYTKRVHHDLIIPQKPFQDTYAYLKGKYASTLIENWAEQTPPEKHVFEDLGIAAFLIELWKDMYGGKLIEAPNTPANPDGMGDEKVSSLEIELRVKYAQDAFPGFVDIGCGNGLLVWILHQEGWKGWGFDARARKTWATFDKEMRDCLKEMLLVPSVLDEEDKGESEKEKEMGGDATAPAYHNGEFPEGTFIISNHADELTVWTPLLGFLSNAPFIAIPCCSHNFGGTRFRAPYKKEPPNPTDPNTASKPKEKNEKNDKGKQPSAYASLCSYITHLTSLVKIQPEKEYLRIPSTRNVAIIGRERIKGGMAQADVEGLDREGKLKFLRGIVLNEMGSEGHDIGQVRAQWLKRESGLMKEKGGAGH